MSEALLIALLQAIPTLYADAQALLASGKAQDPDALEAALSGALVTMDAKVAAADAALDAAAKAP